MIYPCNCYHEAQDKMYGKGKRVHTIGNTHKTCTVCSNKVSLTEDDKKKQKEVTKK